MIVTAKITGIKYTPQLCKELNTYQFKDLKQALEKDSSFIVEFEKNISIAVSFWVSAKRTRSYPYSRVYNTLAFQGKKVSIIPVFKDEGFDGDRDFLQWDTISLMSLLGVYVIISYYSKAELNENYNNKITNQRFNIRHINENFKKLLSYQSDALHWNLSQIDNIANTAKKALDSYKKISKDLDVKMHSEDFAQKRINELLKGKENFLMASRELAKSAQYRESQTIQPKEKIELEKGIITIKNYLGGLYYLTIDEAKFEDNILQIIEAKHTKHGDLPSINDIKDGFVKMILFSNLEDVKVNGKTVNYMPILKLTSNSELNLENLSKQKFDLLKLLKNESTSNNFKILINNSYIENIIIFEKC